MAVKADVKELKGIIKLIKKKAEAVSTGLKGFYDHFDKDKSDEMELAEFIKLIQYLRIELSDRVGIMLFKLFDRRHQGYFSYLEFSDIILRRMKPNYKRIVYAERQRFALEGLNIKFPKKKKPEVQVIYREKIVEVPKEVIKYVPVI